MHLEGLEGIKGLTAGELGEPTLAAAPAYDDREIAGVGRSLALTLAAIHERGYSHRHVEAGRVMVDGEGTPILSGAELCEPSDDHGDDIVQWGQLLTHLLQWGAAADGASAADECRLILSELSDQAQEPDPTRRPTARALAAAITHRLPNARLPGEPIIPPLPRRSVLERLRDEPTEERVPWRDRFGGRTRLIVAGGALVVVGVVAVPAMFAPGRPVEHPEQTTEPAPQLRPPAKDCPPVTPPAADADGDGCEEPVTIEAGVLVVGSLRFSLGSGQDQIVVGDWDCDGSRTPGVLTGATVAVYDDWPATGAETHGRVVASVPGAIGIAVSNRSQCDVLIVTVPDAAPRIIDPRPNP